MNKTLLFVYGTLMPGYGNNRLLEGQEYVGEGFIEGELLALGGIPGLIRVEGDDRYVKGHVYNVDDTALERADRLEGYRKDNPASSMYRRVTTMCSMLDGEVVVEKMVHTYEWNGNLNYDVIVGGDFTTYRGTNG